MTPSAVTRLARAARTAAATAACSRAGGGGGRDVLPRALTPLAGEATAAATSAARRPPWLAGAGRLPVGAASTGGLLVPQRRLFHSTTPAQYSAASTSSSSQILQHKIIYHLEEMGRLIIEKAPGTAEIQISGEAEVLNIFELKGRTSSQKDNVVELVATAINTLPDKRYT